jgi:hypothetical protein
VTGPSAVPPLPQSEPPSRLPQSDTPSRPSRGPLIFALGLTVVWCAFLIGTAWLTANPVTLNLDQIVRAEFVITGTVDSDPGRGEVSVSREWKRNGLKGTIHVENLDEARAHRGATYLMPLSRASTGFRVTETRLSNSPALIYPATAVAIGQLEKILADRHPAN